MAVNTKTTRPASTGAANTTQQPESASSEATAELDYTPKKMTARETLLVSLKLIAIAGVVFGLLWLAHVKLEK